MLTGKLHLSQKFLRFFLIKVQPGSESLVCESLSKIKSQSIRVFVSLGEYDLIAVEECESIADTQLGRRQLKHVLGIREVVAVTVNETIREQSESIIPEFSNGLVHALLFVRTSGVFSYNRRESSAELRFLDWWFTERRQIPTERILASFGDGEFIVLISGRTLLELYDRLSELNGSRVPEEGWIVERTLTVVFVDPSILDPNTSLSLGDGGGVLAVEMSVACRPEHRALLYRAACDALGANIQGRGLRPGSYDFAIAALPGEGDVGKTIHRVLRFRQEVGRLLSGGQTAVVDLRAPSTEPEIDVRSDIQRAIELLEARQAPMPRLVLTEADEEKIGEIPHIGRLVLRALFAFSDMLSNDALSDQLFDMVPFVRSFLEHARTTDTESVDAINRLREWIPLARTGADQRTIGTHPGINPVESTSRHLVGGVHRLFQAAESIPHSVFTESQHGTWPGFVILGPRHHYWGHRNHVIGLSADHMWDPSRWTPLVHETSHCLLLASPDKFCLHTGQLGEIVSRLEYGDDPQFQRVLVECVVDLLQANIGPWWDPMVVIGTYWDGILSSFDINTISEDDKFGFSVRAVIAWSVCDRGDWTFDGKPACDIDFATQADRLAEAYEKIRFPDRIANAVKPILEIHSEFRQEIVEFCKALLPVIVFTQNNLLFSSNDASIRREWWGRPEVEDVIREIGSGAVLPKFGIRYPDLFVYKLWDKYKTRMPEYACAAAIWGLVERFRDMLVSKRDAALAKASARLANE